MEWLGYFCRGACRVQYLVTKGEEKDSSYAEKLLSKMWVCPTCGDPLEAIVGNPLDFLSDVTTTELSARALWRLLNGMGLPGEGKFNQAEVALMLTGASVVGVKTSETNTGRVLLNQIRLGNGKTLHLSASGFGACVYKITEEFDGRQGQELRAPHSEEGTEECSDGGDGDPPSPVAAD